MPTVDSTPAAHGAEARLPALDHLRALAMLVGVLFHAALAYSPMLHPFWPTADHARSPWIDVAVWLPHLVRMPLFFLIAGFFTARLVAQRGMGGMMRHRVHRILLPFVVAWPVVYLTVDALTRWAAHHIAHPSPFLEMVRAWLALPNTQAPLPGTGHLWFLYYLLLFSILTWVGRTLGFGDALRRIGAMHPRTLALLLPIALLPGFLGTSAPHPAPESLLPQLWAIGVYGPCFMLGMTLPGRLASWSSLRAWLVPTGLLAALLYAAFLWRLRVDTSVHPGAAASWPIAVLEATIAAWGTLACLVAGLHAFRHERPWMVYLARSAYWVYLTHLPVLFAVQYALLDVDLAWPWKFLASITATMSVCIGSYELFVRNGPLHRWVG